MNPALIQAARRDDEAFQRWWIKRQALTDRLEAAKRDYSSLLVDLKFRRLLPADFDPQTVLRTRFTTGIEETARVMYRWLCRLDDQLEHHLVLGRRAGYIELETAS